MIQAIIIDDEVKSTEGLSIMLAQFCPQITLKGVAHNAEKGIELISEYNPDLIFLDVEMPNHDGFEFLKMVGKLKSEIIFITAHQQYAIKAIKACALDYLLKPIDKDELIESISKVDIKIKKDKSNKRFDTYLNNISQTPENKQIALSTMEGMIFIKLQNIMYCKGDGAYTFFYLKTGEKIIASKNLKEFEEILSENGFFRTHKSYIIQISEMKKYVRTDGGYALMNNGDKISVSKRRKDDFLKTISSL